MTIALSNARPSIVGKHGFSMTNDKRYGKNVMLRSVTQYRLKQLWEATRDSETSHNGWAYKQKVMECANEIFSAYPSIIAALHSRSLLVQPSHYEFIQDCCRYLDTGVRSMSVNHWNTVLTYEQWPEREFVDDTVRQREERLRSFAKRLAVIDADNGPLIGQWCRQPGGYVDLAYTLKMLFLASED